MATGDKHPMDLSYSANANLAAKQFYGVSFAGNRTVEACNATAIPVGVLQNNPDTAGKACTVRVGGTTKMVCGANLTFGVRVVCDANGAGTPAGSNNAVSYNVLGFAQETAAANDLFELLVQPHTYRPSA